MNFTYSGINNGAFQVKNVPLSISFLGEKTLDELKEIPMKDGIAAVMKLIDDAPVVHLDRSFLAEEVGKRSGGRIVCTSIEQNVLFLSMRESSLRLQLELSKL